MADCLACTDLATAEGYDGDVPWWCRTVGCAACLENDVVCTAPWGGTRGD